MRGLRSLVALVVAAALLVLPTSIADAVGTGNPVIESPIAGAAHYNGFNGPFIVDFDDAPFDEYDYFVMRDADMIWSAAEPYDWDGEFAKPQFTVSALAPGAGYAFHVTDNAGHEATLAFTVLSGTPPTCSILLPSKVRMKARSFLVTATLSAQCKTLHTTYAVWEARHPVGGFAQTFTFDHVRTDYWRIYDDEYTGLYTVRPKYSQNSSNQPVPQNTTRLTMRMDSRLNLTATRSGSYVTLRTVSTRYSASANRYKVWSGRTVVLAYRTCSTCVWKQLKVRTTNRRGVASYRFKASRVRQYRATAAGTSTTWAPRPDYLSR